MALPAASAPAISVILPTYNRAELLPRSILSVLAQSFSDFELIVVDDGSSDSTEQTVASIKDARLRYIRCPRNGGPAYARNRGIELAKAEFIAFQDSDDEWAPNKLELQLKAMQAAPKPLALVFCAYAIHFSNGRILDEKPDATALSGEFENLLLSGFGFIPPTWLARKHCLLEAGLFNEKLPNREDWELVFRLYPRWDLLAMSEQLVTKHVTEGSVEANWRARAVSYRYILGTYAKRWQGARQLMARHYSEMSNAHIVMDERSLALVALWGAYKLAPTARTLTKLLALILGLRFYRSMQTIVGTNK